MSTQQVILNFLEFLSTKKNEVLILKSLDNDYDRIRIFNSIVEDYETLLDQSSLAIKSLQIDNYNQDELICMLREENRILVNKFQSRYSNNNYYDISNNSNPHEEFKEGDKISRGSNINPNNNQNINVQEEYIPREKLNNDYEKGSNITFSKNNESKESKKYMFEDIAGVEEIEEDEEYDNQSYRVRPKSKKSSSKKNVGQHVIQNVVQNVFESNLKNSEDNETNEVKSKCNKVSLRIKLKENSNKVIQDIQSNKNKGSAANMNNSNSSKSNNNNIELLTKSILSSLDDIMLNQAYFIKNFNYPDIKSFLEKIVNYELDEQVLKNINQRLQELKQFKNKSTKNNQNNQNNPNNDLNFTDYRRNINRTYKTDEAMTTSQERSRSRSRSNSNNKKIYTIPDKDPHHHLK